MTSLKGTWTKHVDFRYLSGEDFDQVTTLTIKDVVKEEAYTPNLKTLKEVIVLKFEETDKGIILNLTNSRTITRIVGSKKFEDWQGKKIPFWGQPDSRFGKVIRIKENYTGIKIN